MRVVSGEYKGRVIKAVKGSQTRPTTDKVKESVFHMLGPYFDGGSCLDLFAGSGSLGIEALSRGMDKAIFIDKSGQAIKTIKDNLHIIGDDKGTEIYRNDAFRAIDILAKKQVSFDLVIIDPPYDTIDINKLLKKLHEAKIVNKGGLIYAEYRSKNDLIPLTNWTVIKERKYNETTGMTIFQA